MRWKHWLQRMNEIYLPVLHYFAMDNAFTGSCGPLRFRIVPKVVKANPKEVDMEASSITAQLWHGPLCYECSQMEQETTVPMSEEGRSALLRWLTENV